MRIVAIQTDCVPGDVEGNRQRIIDMIRAQFPSGGPGMAVLPELAFSGLCFEQTKELAESMTGPTVTAMSGCARKLGIHIIAGSLWERVADGQIYNTMVVIEPQGGIAGRYRKIHLFEPMGEDIATTPGDRLATVDIPGLGRVGLAICYDLRFPEMFLSLTAAGCGTFVIPAAWPDKRIEHWAVLAQARAIESLAYVIAVNRAGTDGQITLGGHSRVVDPAGRILAQALTEPAVLEAEIDQARIEQVRELAPASLMSRDHRVRYPFDSAGG